MIVRPFISGEFYPVGAYVSDPETDDIYQVKSPTGDPDDGPDVLVGPFPPRDDVERFSFVPQALLPSR